MIYPFQLSFSRLISASYDTACEIIVGNSARSRALPHSCPGSLITDTYISRIGR